MARGVPVASAIRRPLADRRQLISVCYPSGRYLPVTTPLDDAWSATAAAAAALAPAEFTASYLSSLLWFCVWYTRPRCSFSLCFRCIYPFSNNASLNKLHACCLLISIMLFYHKKTQWNFEKFFISLLFVNAMSYFPSYWCPTLYYLAHCSCEIEVTLFNSRPLPVTRLQSITGSCLQHTFPVLKADAHNTLVSDYHNHNDVGLDVVTFVRSMAGVKTDVLVYCQK